MAVFKKEGRKARHLAGHDAWMMLDGGFAKRNCTVLNLSSGGARIAVIDGGPVDSTLNMAFSKDARRLTPCRLVWRKGREIGVEFIGGA